MMSVSRIGGKSHILTDLTLKEERDPEVNIQLFLCRPN